MIHEPAVKVAELIRRVAASPETAASVAARIADASLLGSRVALSPRKDGQPAARLLFKLDELAVLPEARFALPESASERSLLAMHLHDLDEVLRGSVARAILPLLGERRATTASRRIRDEAYLAMVQTVGADDAGARDEFEKRSPRERDAVIARARRSELWHRIAASGKDLSIVRVDEDALVGAETEESYRTFLAGEPSDVAAAARIRSDAWAVPRALVATARKDPALMPSVRAVVRHLGGLMLTPLLEAGLPQPGQVPEHLADLAFARAAVQTASETLLVGLLQDRRPVPPPRHSGPVPEQRWSPRRVCDDAYMALYRIHHAGDIDAQDDDSFLESSERLRDRLIEQGLASHNWRKPTGAERRADDREQDEEAARRETAPAGGPRAPGH